MGSKNGEETIESLPRPFRGRAGLPLLLS